MDLNGDGRLDIVSGSYSRHDKDMAGLFQVLWGQPDGTFKKPEPLAGSDGKLLILPGDREHVTDVICTRQSVVDLDGDGKLDLVTGNFSGTFAWFRGEGEGRFAPVPEWLQAGGKPMRVSSHGDPCLCDWDGDGDLDLISGSAQGGVVLFTNVGTKAAPEFAAAVTLVAQPAGREREFWSDADLHGPQADTRVNVGDVDGDGKLDLLVGDCVTLMSPAAGLDEAAAKAQLAGWEKEQTQILEGMRAKDTDAQKRAQDAYQKHYEKRDKFLKEERTGFVWVLRRQ